MFLFLDVAPYPLAYLFAMSASQEYKDSLEMLVLCQQPSFNMQRQAKRLVKASPGIPITKCRASALVQDSLAIHINDGMLSEKIQHQRDRQPKKSKCEMTHYRLIGQRGNNILAIQPNLERSPRIMTQPAKEIADPVQVEHGQAKHALVTVVAFQERLVMVLAPDRDIPELQRPQGPEPLQLERLSGESLRVEHDGSRNGGQIGGW